MPSINGLLNYELNEVNIFIKDMVFLTTEQLRSFKGRLKYV